MDDSTPALDQLIASADRGSSEASATLFATLYRELHRIAASQLRRIHPGGSLGATTLLHEAYLDMSSRTRHYPDRSRFLAYASRAMRGVVIDYVRERRAEKRGAAFHLTGLDTQVAEDTASGPDLSSLSDALESLAKVEPPLAELVDLKFFCGFTFEEIAAQRGVSERTVQRDWQKARLFLHDLLAE